MNIKTIGEWIGHSSITITLDRCGHLPPGSAKEALGLLNEYLDRELAACHADIVLRTVWRVRTASPQRG